MRNYAVFLGLILVLGIVSCGKDDNVDPNEEELITTLKLSVTESGSGSPQVFVFKDIDGPAGSAPQQFDSIIINANKSHTVSLQFLNESVSPAEDITVEVAAEADDHQVYFQPTASAISVSNLNIDSKGLPVGITSTWQTGATGTGKMKITLKHKPGTKASGDPVSKGETDVEVEFNVRIK